MHQSSDTQGEHLSTSAGSCGWLWLLPGCRSQPCFLKESLVCVVVIHTHISKSAQKTRGAEVPPPSDFQSSRVIFCSAVASKTHRRPRLERRWLTNTPRQRKPAATQPIMVLKRPEYRLFKGGKGKKITWGITTSPLIRHLG